MRYDFFLELIKVDACDKTRALMLITCLKLRNIILRENFRREITLINFRGT